MTLAVPPQEAVFVGHRGDATNYLENTLPAFAGAAKIGLSHVELDIQITSDGVPIVLHDPNLERTHGLDLDIRKHNLGELSRHGIFDAARFACPVPRLRDFVAWMHDTADMHAFVEIKKESIHTRGRERALEVIRKALDEISGRYTLISYDARILAMAQSRGEPVGYVLPTMGKCYRVVADRLAPEFIFADCRQILRTGAIWPGDWNWASFEIKDITTAQRLINLGVHYLESMNPALFAKVP